MQVCSLRKVTIVMPLCGMHAAGTLGKISAWSSGRCLSQWQAVIYDSYKPTNDVASVDN